jgi:outer membrane protein OmpA-like peptidoglycan-associated protein
MGTCLAIFSIKERVMRNNILAIAALSLITSTVWSADKGTSNRHEAAGLGSGIVVGAAVGGPIGAIIGAAIGGKLGDRFHEEKTARVGYQQQYTAERARAEALRAGSEDLERRLSGTRQRITSLESELEAEERLYRSALQEALNTQIFFRTGESQLHEDSIQSIERMARLIDSLDGFVIRLEGHADARGEESYNEALSEQRAVAVRDALVGAGFPQNRLTVNAAGESFARAEEKDLDALAMERRVHVQLIGVDQVSQVAQQ